MKTKILVAILLLVSALSGAQPVFAASPYDDNYQSLGYIELYNDGWPAASIAECEAENISLNWQEKMTTALSNNAQNNNNGAAGGVIASWEQALENGRWGVSQSNGEWTAGLGYSQVTIYWTENTSLYLDWEEYADQVIAEGDSTMRSVRLSNKNLPTGSSSDCSIYAEINLGPGIQTAVSNASGTTRNLFVYTDNPNYPSGYEGLPIPESYEPPVVIEYAPNWYASAALDWKVDLHDQNFNTFDGILWTCSEDGNSIVEGDSGLAPAVEWKIYDGDTLLDEGVQNATAPIHWQAEKLTSNTTYTINGKYFCGGDVEFENTASFDFVITGNGVLGSQDLMEDCIVDGFPFIDMGACISNLNVVINAITFGIVDFNNNWSSDTECHNLAVLGGWINAPGVQVCPFFPSYVRNAVTPFVTFILGLLTVRYLVMRGSRL